MTATKQTKATGRKALGLSARTAPSAGSRLITTITEWLVSFVAMPDEYALVCALYAALSYAYDRFDAIGYLSLTSAEPQCGKTTVLETMAALCSNGGRDPQVLTDPTKTTIMTMIGDARVEHKPLTIAWDECEKASRESDDRREVINSGYRASGSVPRTVTNPIPMPEDPAERATWQPRVTVYQPTYSPKMFAGIGSLAPTIKDRSIILLMRVGKAARRYRPSIMRAEAEPLRNALRDTMRTFPHVMPQVECEWLQGRESEIWEPLFTVAKYLQLSADQNALLRRACDLLIELKHSDEERRYTMLRRVEDKQALQAGEETLGRRALKDAIAALGSDDTAWTATIIDRMQTTDPTWREYRGSGITDETFASLLATFGVKPIQIKRAGKNRRGYRRADLIGAASKHGIK